MAKVFISHRTADRPFVEAELLPLLRRAGLEPWYAPLDIVPGVTWEREISEALRACEWFLVVLSPRAAHRAGQVDYVYNEVCFAVEHRRGRIVPVLIEPMDPWTLHIDLPQIQHVDYTAADPAAARRRLLQRLGAADEAPDPEPPAPSGPDPAAVVVEPVRIDPVGLAGPVVLPPQVDPPLAGAILQQEGLLATLADAVARLERGDHPGLDAGCRAVEAAEQQWQRLHEDLEAHPPRLDAVARRQVEVLLADDPDAEYDAAYEALRLLPPRDAKAFFQRARNVARARRAYEEGRRLAERVRAESLARLRERLSAVEQELVVLQEEDRAAVVGSYLARATRGEERWLVGWDFAEVWSRLLTLLQLRRHRCPELTREEVRERWRALLAEEDARLLALEQDARWARARAAQTAAALERFLKDFPASPHEAEGRRLLAVLAQKEARRRQAQEAEKEWRRTRKAGTAAAYATFLADYPDAPQAEVARRLRAELRPSEEDCWAEARDSKSVAAYEDFLDRFPTGERADKARGLLAKHWRKQLMGDLADRQARREYLRYRTSEQTQEDVRWKSEERLPDRGWFGLVLCVFTLFIVSLGAVALSHSYWEFEIRQHPDIVPPSQWRYWGLTGYSLTVEQSAMLAEAGKEFRTVQGYFQLLVWSVGNACGMFLIVFSIVLAFAVLLRLLKWPPVTTLRMRAQRELGPLPAGIFKEQTTLEGLRREYLGEAAPPSASGGAEPALSER